MRVDDPYHVKRVEETLKQLKTQYRFASFRARIGDFGAYQIQLRAHGQSWPHTWLDEDDVNESHPELLRLFKDEICPQHRWWSYPPGAIVDDTGQFIGLWGDIQKKRPLGASAVPEGSIKREDGIRDIKPSLTPPPNAPPLELSLAMEGEMDSGGSTTGQPAPREPTPMPPPMLYDPTLYPPTNPIIPKQGRPRALDFDPIDDPPTKKRRVSQSQPPTWASTSVPPPPQPSKTTLFTSNKRGPITRTRDGKFVPVPALPKPPKWGLTPEERVNLGLEPLVVPELKGESRTPSTRTLDSGLYLNLNTPRSQPSTSISETGAHKVPDQNIELEDYEDDEDDLGLRTDDSPQDTPPPTSSWTRPSFLNTPLDREDLDSRFDGPFVSLFIPPWLLVSLQSRERTTTITKGVSLTLKVDATTHSDEIGMRDRLDTWTRRFRRTSEVEICDIDDLPRLLPQSMKLKNLFHQISVVDDAPDRERVVFQELGRYLEENSQFIVLTPSESPPNDPSLNSTDGRKCRLLLFFPKSDIFPFDFGMQGHALNDGLVCYYEDVDLFKFSTRDM